MLLFALVLPRSLRFKLSSKMISIAVTLKDEELKTFTKDIGEVAGSFSDANLLKFEEFRMRGILGVSMEEALRMAKFMVPAIQQLPYKWYAPQLATMQRVFINFSKEDKAKITPILLPFAGAGFKLVEADDKAVHTEIPGAPAKTPLPKEAEISFEELRAWMKSGKKFTLVEVLVKENYEDGHIPGAINVPAEDIARASTMFKKDDVLVVYCRDITCGLSARTVMYLLEQGFKNALAYEGGKLEWLQKGEPLETKDGRPGTCSEHSCIII